MFNTTNHQLISVFQGEVRRAARPGVQEGHPGTPAGELSHCNIEKNLSLLLCPLKNVWLSDIVSRNKVRVSKISDQLR